MWLLVQILVPGADPALLSIPLSTGQEDHCGGTQHQYCRNKLQYRGQPPSFCAFPPATTEMRI